MRATAISVISAGAIFAAGAIIFGGTGSTGVPLSAATGEIRVQVSVVSPGATPTATPTATGSPVDPGATTPPPTTPGSTSEPIAPGATVTPGAPTAPGAAGAATAIAVRPGGFRPELATTGLPGLGTMLIVGVAFVAVGALLLHLARRRRDLAR